MSLTLWVASEPFEFGIVAVPPPAKLVHHNLRKLHAYVKHKRISSFTRISYDIWKHVACNKLQIQEDLAWLYFQTCESLIEQDQGYRLQRAEHLNSCTTPEEKGKWKDVCSIDLLKFLLFLYVQHAHVISLKSSLVTGEEWPSRSKSPELEGRAGIGAKTLDENAQLSFVRNNISEILDLLVEPDAYGTGVDGDSILSLEALRSLSFLIEGSIQREFIETLDEIGSNQLQAAKTGYSKISRTFSLRKVQNWIKLNLKNNPFGISSCISLGQRLRGRSFSTGDESLGASLSSSMGEELLRHGKGHLDWAELQEKLGIDADLNASFRLAQGSIVNKIITNSNFAPDRKRLIICNQVCRRTVARSGEPLSNSVVKIHRCQHTYMYLLSPLRGVTIEKCHDSTIVLGAVETSVNLLACENVQVIAVTRKITINSCRDCTFHLYTECSPVLIGANKNLKFGPYYTVYPSLLEDMTSLGITSSTNYWNAPLDLGSDSEKTDKVWDEMATNEFCKMSIPFDMEGDTKICPFDLPLQYELALKKRESDLEEWHQLVREAGLNKPQRKQLQSLVQSKFQDWLKESGNQQLLESLAPPTR